MSNSSPASIGSINSGNWPALRKCFCCHGDVSGYWATHQVALVVTTSKPAADASRVVSSAAKTHHFPQSLAGVSPLLTPPYGFDIVS